MAYSYYSGGSNYYETAIAPSYKTYSPQNARRSRTGLSNIGNTCFMNTAIQVGEKPLLSLQVFIASTPLGPVLSDR